jgi:hypothetical protein
MNARSRAASLIALVLLSPDPSAAYFEETAVGARGIALGTAAIASAPDASAFYWNPAALARLEAPEVLIDYAKPYGVPDLNVGTAAVAFPFMKTGWAAAWHRLAIADVYSEDQFMLAAGRTVLTRGAHHLEGGLTFKYGRLGFGDETDPVSGAPVDLPSLAKGSLDAGLLWATPWRMDVAWTGRDLVRPRYEFVDGSGGDMLDTRHLVATAIHWNPESTILLGWAQPEDGASTFSAGLEIEFFDVFAIRSGITNLSNVYRSRGSPNDMQFAGGFGVFHRGYHVDAAASTNHDLGASYQVTIRVPIGGGTEP